MADRIKGITVEIGGDTTGLQTALKGVNGEIRSTQSQLKDVEKLLKLDPTNTELLAQKQQLLTKAVDETKEKLNTLKDAAAQAKEQFDKGEITQEQYNGLQREIIATEQELKKLEGAASSSNAKLAEVAAVADKVAAGADKVASATKGLSTAAAAGVAGLGAMAVNAGKAADDLNTMSKQSGFSTEEIQKWSYASDVVDVSVDDIVGAAQKMKKNMVSTSKDTAAAWEKIGVSVKDSNGELRDSNTVFYEAIEGLSKVSNETERDTLAMQLFGKSADSLAGIIDDGGAALKNMGDEAEKSGLILSQDALDGANAFNDGLDTLKAKATQAFMSSGATLAETLLPMMDTLVEKISAVLEWVASLDSGQLKLIGTILLLVAGVSPLATMISKVSTLISFMSSTVIPALSAAFTFLAANPVVAVIAILAALVIAITTLWNKNEAFRTAVLNIWDKIKTGISNVVDAVKTGVTSRFEAIKTGVQNCLNTVKSFFTSLPSQALQWGKNLLQSFIDGIVSKISALKNTVTDVIGSVADFLGFHSPAKKGEGRHVIEWGQNMISAFLEGVEDMTPSVEATTAAVTAAAGAGATTSTTNNSYTYGGVTVANMSVRSENDVKAVAKELYSLQKQTSRGRGIK